MYTGVMMKINKKSNKLKRRLIFFTIIVSAIIGIAAFYITKSSPAKPADESNTSTVTYEQKAQDTHTVMKDDSSTTTTTDDKNNLTITITALGQDAVQGPVLIRTIVDNIYGGTCTYILKKSNITKTYSSDVTFSGTYYSCNYTVPFADLSAGSWTANITVKQNSNSGSIDKTITVQ